MRARANAAGDKMAASFAASHEAYQRGDGAGAKELSNEGKAAKAEMEELNEKAAEWIFRGTSFAVCCARARDAHDDDVFWYFVGEENNTVSFLRCGCNFVEVFDLR